MQGICKSFPGVKALDNVHFELLETQYGEGDAAKSQSIAENYITQGVVGIFGCNEGSTNGAGRQPVRMLSAWALISPMPSWA